MMIALKTAQQRKRWFAEPGYRVYIVSGCPENTENIQEEVRSATLPVRIINTNFIFVNSL